MDRGKFNGRFINASLGALCMSFGLAISYGLYLVFAVNFGDYDTNSRPDEIFEKFRPTGFADFFREVYRFSLEKAETSDGHIICLAIFVVLLAVVLVDNVFNVSGAWERLKKSSERASDCTSGFELGLAFGLVYIFFVPAWFFGFLGWLAFLVVWIAYLLPSMIAEKHHNRRAISVLNILLGWTIIGWIVALVWALTKPQLNGNGSVSAE